MRLQLSALGCAPIPDPLPQFLELVFQEFRRASRRHLEIVSVVLCGACAQRHAAITSNSYAPRPVYTRPPERFAFPQVSLMVLPPPLGQGIPLATFSKNNRRFLMKERDFLKSNFESQYFQVSGIAHWLTPQPYLEVLKGNTVDPPFGAPGAPTALLTSFLLNCCDLFLLWNAYIICLLIISRLQEALQLWDCLRV